MLEIKTLGGLALNLDRKIVTQLGSRKAEALVAYLAVENRPIPRNVVATLLWPESSQQDAAVSMRVELVKLRKSLGDYVEITRDSLYLKPNSDWNVDFQVMRDHLVKGQVSEAMAIYRGDFLSGFEILGSPAFEEWKRSTQTEIKSTFEKGLQEAIETALKVRDFTAGFNLVQKLLTLDPLNELAHQQCMLLHALNNDRTSALVQYDRCVDIMQAELGAVPSQETQILYQRILKEKNLPTNSPEGIKTNLPIPQTSFVGRDLEVFQINKLLRDRNCRLMTLVGPGGCGKSRLALESAQLALDAFPNGAAYISFESCHNADLIISKIAYGLAFKIDSFTSPLDPTRQLIDYLSKHVMLLILDEFEAMASKGKILSRMLEKVPGLKILVTSRQRLGLQGEWVFQVEGLPIPDQGEDQTLLTVDSVQLFLERARQTKHNFHPSISDLRHIAQICQLLEGLPLGIELAAAWTSILTVEEINYEVAANLDFLCGQVLDMPEKHHSIRAVFDSSWNMLTTQQKQLLQTLSIFQGDFDRDAAFVIAQADLAQLSSLVDKSLLHSKDSGRFIVHNLIRKFAAEKLNDQQALKGTVQDRYCRYYTGLLTQHEIDLMGREMLPARQEIRKDMHHIHTALDYAMQNWDDPSIINLLTALLVFYTVDVWYDGVDTYNHLAQKKAEALQETTADDPSGNPIVLCSKVHQAFLLTNLGQIDESEAISRVCLKPLQSSGLKAELSECLHNLGVNASFRGDYQRAKSLLEKACMLGRESGYILWPTYLLWLGHVYFLLGEYEQGLLSLQKCHDIFMKSETLWGAAFALSKMGLASDGLGEHVRAMHYHQEALTVFEQIQNLCGQGYCLSRMSMSACFLGKYQQAREISERAYELFEEIGHRWGISTSLSRIGFADIGLGQIDSAKEMFIEALQLSRQEKMMPLSLYALTGLACVLLVSGAEQEGMRLMSRIKGQPKMPQAYFEQAKCLICDKALSLSQWDALIADGDQETKDVDQLIESTLASFS